jgi:hypothetical protein
MCTVVVLVRPGHDWPVLMAANRDEMVARAWDEPAAYWPDRPAIIAGRDRAAGGTWLGINRSGVVAAVLNRPGSLGPAPGRRSRGMLPLLALDHATAAAGCAAIRAEDAGAYRSFNMVVADRHGAWFIRGVEAGRPHVLPLAAGLQIVTAHDPNDPASARATRHLPRFAAAAPPDPDRDDWTAWTACLADRSGPPGSEINVPERGGFATICASLIGLPADGPARWRFAAGPPDRTEFIEVGRPLPTHV